MTLIVGDEVKQCCYYVCFTNIVKIQNPFQQYCCLRELRAKAIWTTHSSRAAACAFARSCDLLASLNTNSIASYLVSISTNHQDRLLHGWSISSWHLGVLPCFSRYCSLLDLDCQPRALLDAQIRPSMHPRVSESLVLTSRILPSPKQPFSGVSKILGNQLCQLSTSSPHIGMERGCYTHIHP